MRVPRRSSVPGSPVAPRPLRGRLLTAALLALTIACATRTAPPPVPSAPHFPDFVFPAAAANLADAATLEQHRAGWQWLQAGDLRAAERSFTAALKAARGFYPAEAGLGYASLARKDENAAIGHFDRAIAANPGYAPALVGRGDALLASGKRDAALASFEAAVAADPTLAALTGRIEILRFRGLQDDVAAARKAAEAGRLPEARQLYQRAISASPQSPFLYRELAVVERDSKDLAAALAHAQQAAQLEPGEARTLVLIGEISEAQGALEVALQSYSAALSIEPSSSLEARIDGLRARAALAAMPAEYQAIEGAPAVTRAQLAALIGVRLDALLARSSRRTSVVMTDTRDSWAAPWILSVARAGVLEVYANHTFQPAELVRRVDLAVAASRVLTLLGQERPALAAAWKKAAPRQFPDLAPGNLNFPAVSLVVGAGVMAPVDGTFQATRPASGAEAVAAITKLAELANSRGR